ncbi:la-related protein 6A [Canna indica]|uniref:La-related protein 6A n=1 Tax=Canna indica TaxID=4628 RepID=A0AAQ3K220_9LILI|nr:la-related protein 6A [Canna indica]
MEPDSPPSSPLPPPPSPPLADVAPSDASGGGAATRGATPGPRTEHSLIADADSGPQEGSGVSETDPLLDVDAFDDGPDDLSLDAGETVPSASSPAVLSDELRDRIVRQVEYYFSDENLPTDKFLLKFIKRNKEGYVPVAVIASFKRMKKLTQELSLIVDSLRTSSELVVSEDGNKVKRLHPLPNVKTTDAKSRTVVVENLPDDSSEESIQRIFGKSGKIVKVTIENPCSVNKSTSNCKFGVIISSKVHALVEYGTVEAAESAVSSLNDDKNWRTGMRVELLLKRMEKHGLQKGRKVTSSEKKNSTHGDEPIADGQKISVDSHDELTVKEEGEPSKGGRRNRYKNRGRGQAQPKDTAHGVTIVSAVEHVNKPMQGPRMPDGTRGFAFGRGKPAIYVPAPNIDGAC